ncbi:MAG: hypothetical protein BHV88_16400 [Clostridiales bacterium 41_12_two_minus]|nr:MAG: hypothetical protein BHV88_16400 [Clostridiales bacterium 41_12_two_minus]
MKPILFNTEMVRAILDGRKDATRRIVKGLPKGYISCRGTFADGYGEKFFKLPCEPGDILYVRETWHKYTKRIGKGESCRLAEFYGYKASVANSEDAEEPWRPSTQMPKEAARIWLKVTDVRVERLQEITSEQIYREGVEVEYPHVLNGEEKRYAFSTLWNSTIKKSNLNRYGWDANPWVWVIEFERCEKPEGV